MIADPCRGRCHVCTQPKNGEYLSRLTVSYGADIDLTGTVVDLVLTTDRFPGDQR